MDQVSEAARELYAAQAGVSRAEESARRLVEEARARVEDAQRHLAQLIVDGYQAGARVGELAERAAYSRATITRILRGAGVVSEDRPR